MISLKGLILSGGLGTRLRPLTHTGAKQLIPVANKPMIFYAIEDLKNAGIVDIGIVVGHDKLRIESIKNAVGDGSYWGVKITYIEQAAPQGIGHAVLISERFIGNDNFVVYLGDNILKGGIQQFVEEFESSEYDAGILLAKHKYPINFGVAVLDKSGKLIDVEEKPKKPKSNFVITGIYIFNSRIFDVLKETKPSQRGELELTDCISKLIKSKDYEVSSYMVEGYWDDTGDAEAILRANHLILIDLEPHNEGVVEEGARLIGNISIGRGTVIKKGSLIKGPTIIGKNCILGPNTYVGPYTSIGDNSVIVESEIESSIVIGDTKIHFPGKIVDSLIGRNTVINSAKGDLPKGHKFVLGQHSQLRI